MRVKKKDWQTYEKLAEKIYKRLAPEADVRHDDSIEGHDSGTNRQIDVSIRQAIAGHEILVIVQARDRKRAPNVNDVGEFATVVRDVRASKGIMICRKPPGKSALRLAKTHNIEMCSAFDIDDYKWNEEVAVPVTVQLIQGEVRAFLSFAQAGGYALTLPPKSSALLSVDGGKTQVTILDYMLAIAANHGKLTGGSEGFVSEDKELSIQMNEKDWVPVPLFEVGVRTTVRTLFRSCRAEEYIALLNYSTGQLSVAEMKVTLPLFNDRIAWVDAESVRIEDHVKQHIPVIDLRVSPVLEESGFGFRILPLEVLLEERERALAIQS